MYQSAYDLLSLSEIEWSLPNITNFFAAVSRKTFLYFAPNDRYNSILRSSLVANGLDSLSIVYLGMTCLS